MSIRRLIPFFLFLLIIVPLPARAHVVQLSDSELSLQNSQAIWKLRVHLEDFDRFFRGAEETALKAFAAQRLKILVGGQACELRTMESSRDLPKEILSWTLYFKCPVSQGPVQVEYNVFYGDPKHRHLLKLKQSGSLTSFTFSPSLTETSFASSGPSQTFWNFLKLGVEHILIGYDHILFVLTLVFGARRIKSLLWLVTSFTVAHSISLALATLGLVTLPPTIVEPIIAASIVFLAIQDLIAKGEPNFRLLLGLTFGFGLIHGLGFSYVLKEANLTKENLIVPLLSFNLGVELGQIAIVALVFPLLLGLNRWLKGGFSYFRKGALVIIGATGFYWMIERIFGG